jgi:imidazole glycerol-phosphate synthase subunit HisF
MRPRLIPVLLLDRDRRLIKTVAFGSRTYIGDPFNALRLFNEKEVDEIVILDIDATTDGRQPDPGFITELASECFVPLSYGGGLASAAVCEGLSSRGIEKLVFGTQALDDGLVRQVSARLGAQAVIGCIDYRGAGPQARTYCRSGKNDMGVSVEGAAAQMVAAGCGELILQSIDRDGARNGYDLPTVSSVAPGLPVPLVALGGAAGLADFAPVLQAGASAAASGSAFCLIGRLRAVLISYPEPPEITQLGRDLTVGSA